MDDIHGELIRALLCHSSDFITVIKPDGLCIYVSPSVEKILGYTHISLSGINVFDYFHPDDTEKARKMIDDVTGNPGKHFAAEFRCRHADGRWIHLEATGSNQLVNPAIGGIIFNSRDVSERHRDREALKESEQRFKALTESSPSAIFIWQDDRIKYVNPASVTLTGYSREDFYGMNFWDIVHPDFRDDLITRGKSRVGGGAVESHYRFKVITKSGEERWAEVGATLIEYEGRPAVLGSAFDITDYKRIEQDLSRTASEFEAIFRALPDLFFRFNAEGVFLDGRAGNENDMLMPRNQFLGKHAREILPPFLADITVEYIDKALLTGSVIPHEYSLTIDGEEQFFEARYVPVENNQVVTIVRNITEKKKTELELLKAQKLDSIGLLAGGIAHDFNNLLMSILGNISLAKIYAPEGGKLQSKLNEAEKSIDRARELTRQLLTFSRGGAPVKKLLSLSDLLRDTSTLMLSGSTNTCEFLIEKDLWPVEADESQISQVIHNLMINAKQAMSGPGVITVRAENRNIAPNTLTLQGYGAVRTGPYAIFTVTDRGCGIPEPYLHRVFDPYFSMKKGGIGLGLATSYSIIKRHNGYIDLSSREGEGTTITVYLPASPGRSASCHEEPGMPVRGKGHVLIMDDDEAIRDVCVEILERLGYTAQSAPEGGKALEMYRNSLAKRPYSAVIMDLTVIDGMGGLECAEKVLKLDPGARILVSSGYSEDPVVSDYRSYGFSGVIIKPYDAAGLSRALCTILPGEDGTSGD